MVWFQCEDCGENLKKPKLQNHFRICSANKLSCIDCGFTFNKESVQGHTQCVSEQEKYGPKGEGKGNSNSEAKGKSPASQNCDFDLSIGLSTHPPWSCSLCNVKATSRDTLLLHSEGKKHRSKVRAILSNKSNQIVKPSLNGNFSVDKLGDNLPSQEQFINGDTQIKEKNEKFKGAKTHNSLNKRDENEQDGAPDSNNNPSIGEEKHSKKRKRKEDKARLLASANVENKQGRTGQQETDLSDTIKENSDTKGLARFNSKKEGKGKSGKKIKQTDREFVQVAPDNEYKFFSELVKNQVGESDRVIIITHEPNWLLDWYWSDCTGKNVSHLIKDHLKGRCQIRLAGDLHHYMHHSAVPSTEPVYVKHLIVNGCGGAFLHPTHVFSDFRQFLGACYENRSAYPSYEDSKRIALGNILKFRRKNWQFDVIGGIIYFLLVFSTFPQCNLDHILQDDTWIGHLQQCFGTLWHAFMDIVNYSYISLAGIIMLLLSTIMFVPVKLSRRRRAVIGFVHVSAHITAAMILMLLLELGIETCVRHKLLGTSGYHTLYDWYRSVESEHFPDPTGLRTRMEDWTFGLYPACIKYLMSAFDVPEVIAVTRNNICKSGMETVAREFAVLYYICIFMYFWVFSTPVVSLVFGSYLYICVNWLHVHFDEAYSSLRIANYKSFTRFHISSTGNLDVYTLAVNKVPKEWRLDSDWESEQKKQLPSHLRQYPSKWIPKSTYPDPDCTVQIIDHFSINK